MKDLGLDVPGTTRLLDERGEVIGSGEITLVPRPSSDPEDPLNWTRNRKALQFLCVMLYTGAGAFSSACLYSILDPLSTETGLTLDQLNEGTGYQFLMIGVGSCLFQPIAMAFGKKPMFILTSTFTVPVLIWTLYTVGNNQWIANRLIFGLMNCPVYTMVEASIADVFFMHQRAWPMGAYVALSFAGSFVGPIVGGPVYLEAGWKPVIYIAAAFQAAVTIFLFFFLEETNYRRTHAAPLAVHSLPIQQTSGSGVKSGSDRDDESAKDGPSQAVFEVAATEAPAHVTDRLFTPWHGPTPFNYAKPQPHWLSIIVRGFIQPFAMMPMPLIFWTGILVGFYQAMFSISNALPSGIFSAEPYNMSTKGVGLTFLSPLISTIPSSLMAGSLADWYTVRKARKNNGISEAEHKLDVIIIPAILTPIGLLMMGLGPYYGVHWIVYAIGSFLVNYSGPFAISVLLAYIFDCYHELKPSHDGEVQDIIRGAAPYLLSLVFLTMVIVFAFSYAITPWAFTWGLKNFAISSALIAVAFNLTILALIRYGKPLRRWSCGYYVKVISF